MDPQLNPHHPARTQVPELAALNRQAIVSQDEIEALLQGFPSASPASVMETGASVSAGNAEPIAIERVTAGGFARLDPIHRRFALAVAARLSGWTRQRAEVDAMPVTLQGAKPLAQMLGEAVQLDCLELDAGAGHCLLVLQSSWVKDYVDLSFGGPGQVAAGRRDAPLSTTERQASRRLLDMLAQEYQRAWRSRLPIEMNLRSSESHAGLARQMSVDTPMVACSLQLRLGELSGLAWVLFPPASLAPMLDRLGARRSGDLIPASRRSRRHGALRRPFDDWTEDSSGRRPSSGVEPLLPSAGTRIDMRAGELLRSSRARITHLEDDSGAAGGKEGGRLVRVTRPHWARAST